MIGGDLAQLHGVAEDDDRGEQVHAGDPVMLAFGRTVADFTATMEADGSFKRVMGLTLVESDLGAALQLGIQNAVDHEQSSLDAADIPQGCRGFILPRIGGEFAQDLAGCDASGSYAFIPNS